MLVLLDNNDCMYKTCRPQPLGVKTLHQNHNHLRMARNICNVDRAMEIKCKQGKCNVFWLQNVRNNLDEFNPIG